MNLGPALLFCPADRPERYVKALERADAVILDLEDAVAAAGKPGAREALLATPLDPDRVIVRINPLGTAEAHADLEVLARTGYRRIMTAKTESPRPLRALDPRFEVIALLETVRGISKAEKVAALPNVVALMWGAEDLIASLGGTSSRGADGGYRDVVRHARARVLLAAGAHRAAAIDAVHLDIADDAGLRAEATDAAASGFHATACIHPRQVEIVRDAYAPSADAADWAVRVLAVAEAERGVFAFEGRMIDEPVLRQAREMLARRRTT